MQQQQDQNILKNFPKIKLSYETFVHKKVNDANVIIVIPQGKKCFMWIKNGQCYFIENINNTNTHDNQYNIIKSISLSLNCNNTIFYGTLF